MIAEHYYKRPKNTKQNLIYNEMTHQEINQLRELLTALRAIPNDDTYRCIIVDVRVRAGVVKHLFCYYNDDDDANKMCDVVELENAELFGCVFAEDFTEDTDINANLFCRLTTLIALIENQEHFSRVLTIDAILNDLA